MLGWLSSLVEMIAGLIGFFVGFVTHLFDLTHYAIGFIAGYTAMLHDVFAPASAFFAPLELCVAIFVSIAVVRLVVSLGGH